MIVAVLPNGNLMVGADRRNPSDIEALAKATTLEDIIGYYCPSVTVVDPQSMHSEANALVVASRDLMWHCPLDTDPPPLETLRETFQLVFAKL